MGDFENLLAYLDNENIVCPQPLKWNQLYEMLPNKKRVGSGWEPSLPLILAAWDSPIIHKKFRFREHLAWAKEHGCLDVVLMFLKSFEKKDWYYGE